MNQNTLEWLQWRRNGIGSSDVPAIMGACPYRTRLDVYEDKTAIGDPIEKENYVQAKGKRMEPKARALLEIETGKSFAPALLEMEEFPFVRVSLDGKSEDGREIAEFKMVGADSFLAAGRGVVPDHYMIQCQYQLMVSRATACLYTCTQEGTKINVVKIEPDLDHQKSILKAVIDFWTKNVIPRKPPPYLSSDFKELKFRGVASKIEKWKAIRKQIESLQAESDEIADYCKAQLTHSRMQASGVRFLKIQRAGAIEYSAIPELVGVNLEKYRKPPVEYIQMKQES